MAFNLQRHLNSLTSSISVVAIAAGLTLAQATTQKSLAQVTSINGAGSSFAAPLYVGVPAGLPAFAPKGSWFNTYGVGNPSSLNPPGPINSTVTFRYAAVGSGRGVTAFLTQTPPPGTTTIPAPVSFGATDDPLIGTEVVTGGPNGGPFIQVPVAGGAITLAYNSTGLTVPAAGIRLSQSTYCAILNGNITNWNDSRIRNDNGGVVIAANQPLNVVRREDSSGSTFALSNHLNTICQSPTVPAASVWTRGVGPNSAPLPACPPTPANTVCWPTRFLKASGGGAVADLINATPGTIGYVDSATRLSKNLPAAVLRNRSGQYVSPSPASITAAFTGVVDTDSSDRRIKIEVTNPTATTAYPIVTATYLLFYDRYANVSVANGIKGFIRWAVGVPPVPATPSPNTIATARGYAPLPDSIKTRVVDVVGRCVDTVVDPAAACVP
ncbi:substrate-binding domain-containing protein [Nostoc sp. FACHB-110]|uniref:substrate-binding domain-containing protein n=1 Tax=Nostoc sp. FACHB-110 TaxID=2692834 RepID=UPI001682D76A|nr:substrate-binding domain-containing protein [Nostoc sp. FACHB-110]MBD2436124.1 substrate-binding domain-containing protein [Nostoc sp. FACHB-110]